MLGVLQDKVLGRALVELEGDPALGELQELTLLVGRRCRIVIHALGQLTSPDKASSDRVAPSALAKRCGGRVHKTGPGLAIRTVPLSDGSPRGCYRASSASLRQSARSRRSLR